MKEFNLEAAQNGAKICTRDGHNARIICWGIKNEDTPLAVAITYDDGNEDVKLYTCYGKYCNSIRRDHPYPDDLMMAPEKREGWVNIYKNAEAGIRRYAQSIFETKEKAIENKDDIYYVTTVKIEWEE